MSEGKLIGIKVLQGHCISVSYRVQEIIKNFNKLENPDGVKLSILMKHPNTQQDV